MRCNYCQHELYPNLFVDITDKMGALIAREAHQVINPYETGRWTLEIPIPMDMEEGREIARRIGDILVIHVSSNGRRYDDLP